MLSGKGIRDICAMLGMTYGVYSYKLKNKTLKLRDIELMSKLFPELTLTDLLLSTRHITRMDQLHERKKRKDRLPGQYPHNTILKPVKKPVPPQLKEAAEKMKANNGIVSKKKTWFNDV